MQDDLGASQRTVAHWIRIWEIFALGLLCWLSRMSLPHDSVTLELDPSYQQALGVALKQGMRFGRDIVFTSGPLAYFRASPFDADLYWAKFWLWEVLLGAAIALLLFSRLLRRGRGIDVIVGILVLIVVPRRGDEWVFLTGLLAADLGLESIAASARSDAIWKRGSFAFAALLLLSILTLVKVTSITVALGVLLILMLRATSRAGARSGLRWAGAWTLVQGLLWLCIGQKIQDLPAYFSTSLELASGFDSAMSLAAPRSTLILGLICLGVGLILAAFYARKRAPTEKREFLDDSRAQALTVAMMLLLAYKAGFTRADHVASFFSTAMVAPLFLIPFGSRAPTSADWKQAWLRCAIAVATTICALSIRTEDFQSPGSIAKVLEGRIRASIAWISRPKEIRGYLIGSREKQLDNFALPRIKAIVGSKSISAFTVGDGVLFLNGLRWKPRPVFQSFSVFTQKTARLNADFLSSDAGPDFILMRTGAIDRRLPSSEDPLALQVLLRNFRMRANETGFLLLERLPPRASETRTELARGAIGWNEKVDLPRDAEPLVLQARIRPSLLGRIRSALYQTPEVFVEAEFEDGHKLTHRIAPFALEAGVVVKPWLPTNADWVYNACGKPLEAPVALRFHTPAESAFSPSIEFECRRALDLHPPQLDPITQRELVLGAAGDLAIRYESTTEPELAGWTEVPMMLFVHAPANLYFAAGPGRARITAKLSIPPWLLSAPDFPGVEVKVWTEEGDAPRECERFEFGVDRTSTALDIDVEVNFAIRGALRLELTPLPGGDPLTANLGIRKLRVR